jgi:protein phosphatase
MGLEQPGLEEKSSAQKTTVIVPAPDAKVRAAFGAMTHVGKVRANNEDQFLVARVSKVLEVLATSLPDGNHSLPDQEGFLLLVADGIGGAGGGEHASALAVEEAKTHIMRTAKWFFRLDDPDEEVRLRNLRATLEGLDRRLVEEAEADPSMRGMGTTLTAACTIGAEAFFVHVGDSRAYLFRAAQLHQLTHDHTIAQELIDSGVLAPEEARTHRTRHILTNALGGRLGVRAEIHKLRLRDGDRLLLCTDGLTDLVEDALLAELLQRYPQPKEACQALVDAALERGGRDNITVVVAAYTIQPA